MRQRQRHKITSKFKPCSHWRQRLFWVLKLPLPYEQLIMQLAVNYALAYVKTHTWYQRNIVYVKEKLTLSQLLVFLVNGP